MKAVSPDLVLYHARCPDGFGSAWVYWQALREKAVYVPVSYGQEPPNVRGHHVLMVDVSFARPLMETLCQQALSFRLLDHHKSACDELADMECAHFNLGKAGVGLAWEDLHGDQPLPRLVQFIQERDLDRTVSPGGVQVLHVLDALPYDFEAWDKLCQRVEDDFEAVVAEGAMMEKKFEALTERLLTNATPIRMGGHRGLAINAPMEFASALGERVSRHAEFCLTWFLDAAGRVHVSWRSHRVNVIPMAVHYGGGGHPHSAGARISLSQLESLLGHSGVSRACPVSSSRD